MEDEKTDIKILKRIFCLLILIYTFLKSFAVDPSGSHYTSDTDVFNGFFGKVIFIILLIIIPIISFMAIKMGNGKDEKTGESDNTGCLGWAGLIIWIGVLIYIFQQCSH